MHDQFKATRRLIRTLGESTSRKQQDMHCSIFLKELLKSGNTDEVTELRI
jgi:hypothetical protein